VELGGITVTAASSPERFSSSIIDGDSSKEWKCVIGELFCNAINFCSVATTTTYLFSHCWERKSQRLDIIHESSTFWKRPSLRESEAFNWPKHLNDICLSSYCSARLSAAKLCQLYPHTSLLSLMSEAGEKPKILYSPRCARHLASVLQRYLPRYLEKTSACWAESGDLTGLINLTSGSNRSWVQYLHVNLIAHSIEQISMADENGEMIIPPGFKWFLTPFEQRWLYCLIQQSNSLVWMAIDGKRQSQASDETIYLVVRAWKQQLLAKHCTKCENGPRSSTFHPSMASQIEALSSIVIGCCERKPRDHMS